MPEWTLSTDDGKVHRLRDLNTLQKWIVERKVGRSERISRAGGPWLALEDVVELIPFFNVVDEADRARASTGLPGGMPTAPRFPSPSGAWMTAPAAPAPQPRSPSGPVATLPAAGRGGASTPAPPPVPMDARRPISDDGPTVPNRKLPGIPLEALRDSNGAGAPSSISQVPLPGLRDQPGTRGGAGSRTGRRTSGVQASVGGAVRSPSGPIATFAATGTEPAAVGRPPALQGGGAPGGVAGEGTAGRPDLKEGIRRAAAPGAPATQGWTAPLSGSGITAETYPLEGAHPSHQGRTALVVVGTLLLAAAAGGYWWWTDQRAQRRSPAVASTGADTGASSAAPETPPVAAGEPAGSTPPSPATGPGDQGQPAPSGQPAPAPRVPAAGSERPAAPVGAAAPAGGNTAGTATSSGTVVAGAGAAADGRPGANIEQLPAAGGAAGRTPAASRATVGAVAVPPRSYDALVKEADRLLERGRSAKADKLYAQALAARPDGVAALTGAAYVLLDRQRHFAAIETFRKALAVQPTFGPALFGIAESYRARGDTAQALGAYRQYLAIAPSGTDAAAARRQVKELESAAPPPTTADPPERPSGKAAPEGASTEQE